MRKKDTCYFCTSTFQLYAILSLAFERNEKADLYIDPQFKDADSIAERIRNLNLFSKVTIVNSQAVYKKYMHAGPGLKNHFEIAKSYFFVNKIARIILQDEVVYNNIFVSTKAYIPRMVYLYCIRKRANTTIHYFDDGIGSYFSNQAYQPRKLDSFVRYILFGKKANDISSDRYLFSPEVYIAVNPKSNISIFRIHPIWDSPNGLELLNNLFSWKADYAINEETIILDEPLDATIPARDVKLLENAYNLVFSIMGNDKAIIKKHPRSMEVEKPSYNYYKTYGIPFETICMNMDTNRRILISYGSTATATPKLLLGKEPYIIILYRIIKYKREMEEYVETFFSKIKEIYDDKIKVMLPESIGELQECLLVVQKELEREKNDCPENQ